MTEVCMIVGSPYCGSTLLSEALSTAEDVVSIGEAQRFRRFKQFEHVPAHYLDNCSYCSTQSNSLCPVWSLEDGPAEQGIAAQYDDIVARTGANLVIDSSKEIDWLAALVQESRCHFSAVLLTRNPISFYDSNSKRVPSLSATGHIQGWCNIYKYSLKVLSRLSIPHIVVRYEDFLVSPESTSERIIKMCGTQSRPQIHALNRSHSHPLGGNLIQLARSLRFDVAAFRAESELPLDDFAVQTVLNENFTQVQGFKPLKQALVDSAVMDLIVETTDVLEIASYLGYGKAEIYRYGFPT